MVSKQIRELNFGSWEGLTFDEIKACDEEYQKLWLEDPYQYAPPHGETLLECMNRVTGFLQPYQQDNALIVTHGGVIGALLYYYFHQAFYIPDVGTCVKIDFHNKLWSELCILT